MKIAQVILNRDPASSSTIVSKQYVETIPFWKITWAPHHIVFHTNETDENKFIAYKSDRVFEIMTEDLEK